MTLGYIGLAVSFLLVALVLLNLFIRSKIPFGWKLAAITIVTWYGLVAVAIPDNFAGWAKKTQPPDGLIVLGLFVDEPSKFGDGGIYFWGIPSPSQKELVKIGLNPRDFTAYIASREPRCYKMPYDKEFHRKLIAAQREKEKNKSGILTYQRGNKPARPGQKKDGFVDDSGFKLKDLNDLFPKVEEQNRS